MYLYTLEHVYHRRICHCPSSISLYLSFSDRCNSFWLHIVATDSDLLPTGMKSDARPVTCNDVANRSWKSFTSIFPLSDERDDPESAVTPFFLSSVMTSYCSQGTYTRYYANNKCPPLCMHMSELLPVSPFLRGSITFLFALPLHKFWIALNCHASYVFE